MSYNSPIKTESKENGYIEKISLNELYNSYLTAEELKRHPEITPAIKGDKKFRLDILSNKKPKIISIKGSKNENKVKFANRLNSFHKIFFNYYKNNKNSLEHIRSLSKENRDFIKKYKKTNKKDNNDKFNDIKEEYEKRNYYVPPLDEKKNIFNGNILLSNNEELKNYILYDLGNRLSNSKSLSFLHKVNRKLGDKTSEKALRAINESINIESFGKDKIVKDQMKEIEKAQNDIINIKETINSIDEIDYFFDINNKQYLSELRNKDSRGNSAKFSTRVNSPTNRIENVKYQGDVNPMNNPLNRHGKFKVNSSKNLLKDDKFKKKGINKNKIYKLFNDENAGNNERKNYRNYIGNNAKTIENEINKLNLERLYDRISTKENLLNYQHDIKDYLKNKKYDLTIKTNPSAICNNFEITREKVCQSEFLKQDMHLRKQMGDNSIENIEKMNYNDFITKNKVNNIEDKIIKLYCDIDNPRKKPE